MPGSTSWRSHCRERGRRGSVGQISPFPAVFRPGPSGPLTKVFISFLRVLVFIICGWGSEAVRACHRQCPATPGVPAAAHLEEDLVAVRVLDLQVELLDLLLVAAFVGAPRLLRVHVDHIPVLQLDLRPRRQPLRAPAAGGRFPHVGGRHVLAEARLVRHEPHGARVQLEPAASAIERSASRRRGEGGGGGCRRGPGGTHRSVQAAKSFLNGLFIFILGRVSPPRRPSPACISLT